jgi:hypothetical protein
MFMRLQLARHKICAPDPRRLVAIPAAKRHLYRASGALVMALALALPATPSRAAATAGPFAELAGVWSGGGTIAISGGGRERIQCRANYAAGSGGNALDLTLRCAGDSYTFNFHGNARYRDGSVVGSWSESTMNTSGEFSGRANGDHIDARVTGDGFSASLDLTTHGNRQSISIRSPGSSFLEVSVSLQRR